LGLPLKGFAYFIAISYYIFMLKIAYSKKALNDLRKIPVNEQKRIRSKIQDYAEDQAAHRHHVKKLKGREGYRLRVGDWRVIFDIDGNVMAVYRVRARGSVYS